MAAVVAQIYHFRRGLNMRLNVRSCALFCLEPMRRHVRSWQNGANPLGYMIFTASGHFSWSFMRADRPNSASKNRQQARRRRTRRPCRETSALSAHTRSVQNAH